MDIKKLQNYWLAGYKDALLTAEKLYEAKRYHHALFFGHFALEKLLKAVVVKKTKTHATPTHDLRILIKEAKLDLRQDYLQNIKNINAFNIRARYDDIKLDFYKLATKEYTQIWFSKIKEICLWLEKKI